MMTRSDVLLAIQDNKFTDEELVSILILVDDKLQLNTISGQAKVDSKTRRGIEVSNKYMKLKLSNIKVVIPKLRNNERNLPF